MYTIFVLSVVYINIFALTVTSKVPKFDILCINSYKNTAKLFSLMQIAYLCFFLNYILKIWSIVQLYIHYQCVFTKQVFTKFNKLTRTNEFAFL